MTEVARTPISRGDTVWIDGVGVVVLGGGLGGGKASEGSEAEGECRAHIVRVVEVAEQGRERNCRTI